MTLAGSTGGTRGRSSGLSSGGAAQLVSIPKAVGRAAHDNNCSFIFLMNRRIQTAMASSASDFVHLWGYQFLKTRAAWEQAVLMDWRVEKPESGLQARS